MVTVALTSFKGGVGKSSLAVLLGNCWAASGRRVLLIDLDHQRNATRYHATDAEVILHRNISEAFHRGSLEGNILPSHIEGIDFVAGSFGILGQRAASPRTLGRLLEPVRGNYDVAVIDCPPTLDNIVLNAWQAADRIITPARLDGFDLEGVAAFGQALRAEIPEREPGWSIVINFYRAMRSASAQSMQAQLEHTFEARYPNLCPVRIPETVAIAKAVHEGETVTTALRTAKAYEALVSLSSSVLEECVVPVGGTL